MGYLFMEFGGRTYLDDIRRDFLTHYLIHLRKHKALRPVYDKPAKTWRSKATNRPLSPKTIKHYVCAAAELLRWAKRNDWLAVMPDLPDLPRAVRKARDVEPKRLREILDDCPTWTGNILRFIAYTGSRPGEACRLEWSGVRLDLGICVLSKHKTAAATGKPRTIYLTPESADPLRKMKFREGFVFVNRYKQPYTPAGLRTILRRRGITPYQLRHSFAQAAADSGVPTEVLSKLLGHSDEGTAKFYREVRDGRAVEVARRIRLLPPAG